MKKTFRRLVSLVLALVMAMSLAVSASAAELVLDDLVQAGHEPVTVSATAITFSSETNNVINYGACRTYICTGPVTVTNPGNPDCGIGKLIENGAPYMPQLWEDWKDLDGANASVTLTEAGKYILSDEDIEYAGKLCVVLQVVNRADVPAGSVTPGLHNFKKVNTYTEGQYSDVPSTHTFSENAKAAYEFDIMQGYGSTFGVGNNITRLASIIIACRLNCIYFSGVNNIDATYSGTTQQRYMAYAKDYGIFCNFDDVSKNATRAEFAAILASAFPDEALKAINTVEDEAIPDVNVRTTYADAIYRLYRAGILNGSDAKGTFYPTTYITRGAACAIATRMCDESLRKSVNLTKQDISVDISGSITIYENQYSPRLARAGDTYVKADGTKVILKVGPNGILGEGQGVAPDKNLKMENVWWTGNRLNFWASEVGRLTDSLGNHLQNANYIVNFTTGEGHWDTEWNVIYSQYTKPTKPGTYAGQVSTDPYHLWFWDGLFWSWNY